MGSDMDEPIFDINAMLDNGQTLSPLERQLRDNFVDEYLKDFSATKAALRVGFVPGFAEEMAKKLVSCGYVQRQILHKQETNPRKEKDTEEAEKKEILNMLRREANYHGPGASHGARVQAVKAMATIYGMEAPKKQEITHVDKSGVMQVPEMTNPDKWSELAEGSQAALKDAVRH